MTWIIDNSIRTYWVRSFSNAHLTMDEFVAQVLYHNNSLELERIAAVEEILFAFDPWTVTKSSRKLAKNTSYPGIRYIFGADWIIDQHPLEILPELQSFLETRRKIKISIRFTHHWVSVEGCIPSTCRWAHTFALWTGISPPSVLRAAPTNRRDFDTQYIGDHIASILRLSAGRYGKRNRSRWICNGYYQSDLPTHTIAPRFSQLGRRACFRENPEAQRRPLRDWRDRQVDHHIQVRSRCRA